MTVKCSRLLHYTHPVYPLTWASVCSVTVAGSQRCQPTNSSRSRDRVAKARVAGAKPASRESSRQVCSWHIRRATCCETDNFISSRTFGQCANSSAWNYSSRTVQLSADLTNTTTSPVSIAIKYRLYFTRETIQIIQCMSFPSFCEILFHVHIRNIPFPKVSVTES